MSTTELTRHLIKNIEQWRRILPRLEEASNIFKTSPPTHVIGVDMEYVNHDCTPTAFKTAVSTGIYTNTSSGIAVTYVQIASNGIVIVIDLCRLLQSFPLGGKCRLPRSLSKIITCGNWKKGGIGIDLDIAHFCENFGLGHCRGVTDLQPFATMAGMDHTNLDELGYRIGCKGKLPGRHDWSKELTVSSKAFDYACQDAVISARLTEVVVSFAVDKIATIVSDTIPQKSTHTDMSVSEHPSARARPMHPKKTHDVKIDWVSRLNSIYQSSHHNNVKTIAVPRYSVSSLKLRRGFASTCTYHPSWSNSELRAMGVGRSKSLAKQHAAELMVKQLSHNMQVATKQKEDKVDHKTFI